MARSGGGHPRRRAPADVALLAVLSAFFVTTTPESAGAFRLAEDAGHGDDGLGFPPLPDLDLQDGPLKKAADQAKKALEHPFAAAAAAGGASDPLPSVRIINQSTAEEIKVLAQRSAAAASVSSAAPTAEASKAGVSVNVASAVASLTKDASAPLPNDASLATDATAAQAAHQALAKSSQPVTHSQAPWDFSNLGMGVATQVPAPTKAPSMTPAEVAGSATGERPGDDKAAERASAVKSVPVPVEDVMSTGPPTVTEDPLMDLNAEDYTGKDHDQIAELILKNAEAKILKEETLEVARKNVSQEEILRHRQRIMDTAVQANETKGATDSLQKLLIFGVIAAGAVGFAVGLFIQLKPKPGSTKLVKTAGAGSTKLYLADPFVFEEGELIDIGNEVYQVDTVEPFRVERPVSTTYPQGTAVKASKATEVTSDSALGRAEQAVLHSFEEAASALHLTGSASSKS